MALEHQEVLDLKDLWDHRENRVNMEIAVWMAVLGNGDHVEILECLATVEKKAWWVVMELTVSPGQQEKLVYRVLLGQLDHQDPQGRADRWVSPELWAAEGLAEN